VYIRACGEISHAVSASPPELKDRVIEAAGQPLRRASRFMQLAIIGAARCMKGINVPRDTGVYLASGRGDLEIIQDVLEQVFRDGQSPKPLHFVNTVSNAACFQVAKVLGLEGRSSFTCHPTCAIENTLRLALADLDVGSADRILVGTVDAAIAPLEIHRVRLGVPADTLLGEGSHWLLLQKDPTDALAQITDWKRFDEPNALTAWLREQTSQDPCVFGFGPGVSAAMRTELKAVVRAPELQIAEHDGYYDSRSGAIIPAFLRASPQMKQLLYVNGDADRQAYSAILVRRC
jgi:hypothetical protein